MSTLMRGFQNRYPQEFLDELAKACGFEWYPVKFTPVPKDKVEVKPLGPPTNMIFYMDIKIKDDKGLGGEIG